MESFPDRPVTPVARSWPLVGALAVLAVTSLLNNVVAPDLYLLWAALAVVALVLLAAADGLHTWQWGLGPIHRRAGLAALGFGAATAGVLLLATQLPGVSSAFLDDRVSGLTAGDLAFAALIRAPLGTAVLEEIAFRGILLAMLTRRFGLVWGVVGSSVAFGLWHLVPAVEIAGQNAALSPVLGGHQWSAAVAGVVAAALAGVFLCLLRIRYDHLVVPIAVHATANSLGYVLAWSMLVD